MLQLQNFEIKNKNKIRLLTTPVTITLNCSAVNNIVP